SLSSDGNTIAIGARTASNSGHTRIFDWNGSAWVQRGTDIDGETAGDQSGYSVSLSADGNTVGIVATLNDGNGMSSGHARIFDWNGSDWVRAGTDIDGVTAGDQSAYRMLLPSAR